MNCSMGLQVRGWKVLMLGAMLGTAVAFLAGALRGGSVPSREVPPEDPEALETAELERYIDQLNQQTAGMGLTGCTPCRLSGMAQTTQRILFSIRALQGLQASPSPKGTGSPSRFPPGTQFNAEGIPTLIPAGPMPAGPVPDLIGGKKPEIERKIEPVGVANPDETSIENEVSTSDNVRAD